MLFLPILLLTVALFVECGHACQTNGQGCNASAACCNAGLVLLCSVFTGCTTCPGVGVPCSVDTECCFFSGNARSVCGAGNMCEACGSLSDICGDFFPCCPGLGLACVNNLCIDTSAPPTQAPTDEVPPTTAPTNEPQPTFAPTPAITQPPFSLAPLEPPATEAPTAQPTELTPQPTPQPTGQPTEQPTTTESPTSQPTTAAPTSPPVTNAPTEAETPEPTTGEPVAPSNGNTPQVKGIFIGLPFALLALLAVLICAVCIYFAVARRNSGNNTQRGPPARRF